MTRSILTFLATATLTHHVLADQILSMLGFKEHEHKITLNAQNAESYGFEISASRETSSCPGNIYVVLNHSPDFMESKRFVSLLTIHSSNKYGATVPLDYSHPAIADFCVSEELLPKTRIDIEYFGKDGSGILVSIPTIEPWSEIRGVR